MYVKPKVKPYEKEYAHHFDQEKGKVKPLPDNSNLTQIKHTYGGKTKRDKKTKPETASWDGTVPGEGVYTRKKARNGAKQFNKGWLETENY